jgi:ubiquinone biosynthesis protein
MRRRTPQGGPFRKASAMRNLLRLISVVWVLLPDYSAFRRFVSGTTNHETPNQLVAHLEQLGPAFVKLGQMLSTRPELMPEAYVEALSHLQENGPEIPGEVIRAPIES